VRFGRMTLLQSIDMTVRTGEIVGLIGPNGSGKTTLLRILANLRAPDGGTVSYAGQSAAEIGARRLSQQLAYLAQGANVYWPMQVETLVGLGRLPYRRPMQRRGGDARPEGWRSLSAAVATLKGSEETIAYVRNGTNGVAYWQAAQRPAEAGAAPPRAHDGLSPDRRTHP
jgi:ABC-type cobalamin/Fe3+-siderophores transport system ATPase subunit